MGRPQKNVGLSQKNTDPVSRRPDISVTYTKVEILTMFQPHKMSDFLLSYFNLAWENSRQFYHWFPREMTS